MKRCPTCDRTFDDNMRFCQTDGTALVDAPEPVDPYKTMVARPEDIAAAIPKAAETPQPEQKAEDEVLEIPSEAPSDPKKTMYASEAEIRQAMSEVDEQVIEVPPIAEPEPPQFIEQNLGSAPAGGPPPSPFGMGDDPTKTTPPIPSPFEREPPKFEPAEEKFEAPEPERPAFAEPERPFAAEEPAFGSPFAASSEPSAPLAQAESMPPPAAQDTNWQDNQMQNPQFQNAVSAGQNKTLAIISLVLGILGFTLCCGTVLPSLAAIITGVMARGKANNDPAQFGGAGLAIGGIITGVLGLVISIGYLIFVFFLGGMQMIMQQQNF